MDVPRKKSTPARKAASRHKTGPVVLTKCPTGITGLDQITNGGLPRGRPTLVCGGSGSGKTLLAMEFIVRGAIEHGDPGVFMSFEEGAEELAQNVASLGFDLHDLIARKLLVVDYVAIERSEIEETGEYDLEGLFVRLGLAIDAIGAKRVALDTIEALFAALPNTGILRAELRRLFHWLKNRGMTAVVTGERGEASLTRHGLEEYVSDCVILLDQRVVEEVATRRLRIVKYRGSAHGTNEFPFLIDETGFAVQPVTGIVLDYKAPADHASTGVPQLDQMLGGKGYYRGGSMLISGGIGTGKTSLAMSFVDAACRRGERCLYFAFEESPDQIVRNMASIGLDLGRWINKGLLMIHSARPVIFGLEAHLRLIRRLVDEFQPQIVAFDPISAVEAAGSYVSVRATLMLLVDYLKSRHVTTLFTSLTESGGPSETSEVGISSLIDTWIMVRNLELAGERTRGLYVLKARGMAHSNQVREFLLTDHGIDLIDVYVGPAGILTGSAKATQELQDKAAAEFREREAERKRLVLENKQRALEAHIAELRAEFESERREVEDSITQEHSEMETTLAGRSAAGKKRGGGRTGPGDKKRRSRK
ncbi:MAG TPA: circadian clock protein KaiC [Gallionella sp.]|nr:circadian clock protein KaiC [Gallionella sp.]